ncbi:MAG TPA: hypothetical protein VGV13_10320 [Methylomirabilota bacterium]|jgi:hypothetical protein|nr:hypothetical protein [Methylomirabilota bacterium]
MPSPLREGITTESGRVAARWMIAARLASDEPERRLGRRNPVLGEASEGAVEAPSDIT